MKFSIRNFPLTIDPSVDLLEAQVPVAEVGAIEAVDGSHGTWTVLHRIPTTMVFDIDEAPAGARHFFGDHRALLHCRFLVCYDATGALTHLMVFDGDGRILTEELPNEFLGRATELPSVRLVFKNPEDRDRFVAGMFQGTLDSLAEPPRLVGVSVVTNGT